MSTRLRSASLAIALLSLFALPERAQAARVLFVSDNGTDLSIEGALTSEGHDVMTVGHDFSGGTNPSFHGNLSSFDCIVWSATRDDMRRAHSDSAAFAALRAFVSDGGSVFVTGYGAVGYSDAMLIDFVGGSAGDSGTGTPLRIVNLDTDLTTGVLDIRAVLPANLGSDYEALLGLRDDTTIIVPAMRYRSGAQWSIRTLGEGHIAWVAGIDGMDGEWTNTSTGPAGVFNAALRNFVAASAGTASIPGAPRIAFTSPFSANEGDALVISTRVTDPEGDTTTFSWDLDGDGTYGEHPGEHSVTIPAGTTDGPSNFVVGVHASDGIHVSEHTRSIAIANVAPRITSQPPMRAAVDQHLRYALVVVDPGGVHDVPTFTMRIGPSSAALSSEGVFDWTPSEADISAAGASHPVSIDVDDGDMGLATQAWSLTVLGDHAPSDPTLLYPSINEALLIPGIHFAIANASDLDGDALTYTFELASTEAFDVDRQTSDTIAGEPTGITEWRPDQTGLHYGRWYWRVSANDGQVSTSPVGSSFLLVPDPSMFPDTGPRADAGRAIDPPRGCACGIASSTSFPPPFLVIAALIGVALRRSLRRR